jgi:hypothetical protein
MVVFGLLCIHLSSRGDGQIDHNSVAQVATDSYRIAGARARAAAHNWTYTVNRNGSSVSTSAENFMCVTVVYSRPYLVSVPKEELPDL